MSVKWQIFGLGTNNWQSAEEPAPGSGILHHGHHVSLNSLPGVKSYSLWPSPRQKNPADASTNLDHRIFELPHDIPICESVGPVSSYRWHSMSEEEVNSYRSRMLVEAEKYINEVEAATGTPFNLFIAHHTFMNPTVLIEINNKRMAAGKPRVPIVVFAHGTALKMFQNEKAKLPEYPMRFLSWIEKEHVFCDDTDIVGAFAIGESQKATFNEVFPDYPLDKIRVTPNGYNQTVFRKQEGATPATVLTSGKIPPFFHEGFDGAALPEAVRNGLGIAADGTLPKAIDASKFDRIVLFTGRFADWKRIDVVLKAAKLYEATLKAKGQTVATLIAGTGPVAAQTELADLAYKTLQLEHTFFVGPQTQPNLALLNTIVDIGVYPSKDEPFGLVFIECMACGTPVIGAQSGGPLDFVNPEVGELIAESENADELAGRLSETVLRSFDEDWKGKRGERCVDYVTKKFSLLAQCTTMLDIVENVFLKSTEKPLSSDAPRKFAANL